jgi:hypothetical protein
VRARALTALLLTALLLAALAVAPVSGQVPIPTPKRGGGLWGDVGVGYGRLRVTCATCPTVVVPGGTAVTVSAGFTPARNVLLGLQAQQWSSSGGAVVSSLLAVVQWYPWPATGLFMRAGNGIVRGHVTSDAGGAATAQRTGVGFALGLGYDVKVSRRLGLTVQAATHISALGNVTVDGQPPADVIAYVSRIGVAVVLR